MKFNFKLLVSITLPLLAGFIGSIFTTSSIPVWYVGLTKPMLTPPAWVFAPVWTTLYILMGFAAYLVWLKGWNEKGVRAALGVYMLQLVLNTLWSVVFFGLRNPGAALIEMVFLWVSIVATIVLFAKISKPAAWILSPYILWVSFAAYLNYSIWALN